MRIEQVDVAANAERMFALYEANGEDDRQPRAVLADGNGLLWLAEDGGALLGLLLAREQPDREGRMRGFIDNLLVDAAAQRRGIGRALMERTEAYFRERGLVGMQTGGRADNEVALRLYASMGYRVVEEYVRRRRVPVERRVRMWKEFAPRPQPPL